MNNINNISLVSFKPSLNNLPEKAKESIARYFLIPFMIDLSRTCKGNLQFFKWVKLNVYEKEDRQRELYKKAVMLLGVGKHHEAVATAKEAMDLVPLDTQCQYYVTLKKYGSFTFELKDYAIQSMIKTIAAGSEKETRTVTFKNGRLQQSYAEDLSSFSNQSNDEATILKSVEKIFHWGMDRDLMFITVMKALMTNRVDNSLIQKSLFSTLRNLSDQEIKNAVAYLKLLAEMKNDETLIRKINDDNVILHNIIDNCKSLISTAKRSKEEIDQAKKRLEVHESILMPKLEKLKEIKEAHREKREKAKMERLTYEPIFSCLLLKLETIVGTHENAVILADKLKDFAFKHSLDFFLLSEDYASAEKLAWCYNQSSHYRSKGFERSFIYLNAIGKKGELDHYMASPEIELYSITGKIIKFAKQKKLSEIQNLIAKVDPKKLNIAEFHHLRLFVQKFYQLGTESLSDYLKSNPKLNTFLFCYQTALAFGDVSEAENLYQIFTSAKTTKSKDTWQKHVAQVYYHIQCGDQEKAREVARGATKSATMDKLCIQLEHHLDRDSTQLAAIDEALKASAESEKLLCEAARLCMNPLSIHFDLNRAQDYFNRMSISGNDADVLIEQMRLYYLKNGIFGYPATKIENYLYWLNPSYGDLWLSAHSSHFTNALDVINIVKERMISKITQYGNLYQEAKLAKLKQLSTPKRDAETYLDLMTAFGAPFASLKILNAASELNFEELWMKVSNSFIEK